MKFLNWLIKKLTPQPKNCNKYRQGWRDQQRIKMVE